MMRPLLFALLLRAVPAVAQVEVQAFAGSSVSLPSPLSISQAGRPDIRLWAHWATRPFQGTPEEHAVVVGWSKHPNVVMKLSSLPVREKYPHRDPAPVVKQLCEAYGASRLVYGGGFNAEATAESYRAARQRVADHLPDLTDDEIANVLGGNAARLFGLSAV